MMHATFHGKLSREQENMEDILTSNVFGLLDHLPAHESLLPFLAEAEAVDGAKPLSFLVQPSLSERIAAEPAEFWPNWSVGGCMACEPDVVLRLRLPDGRKMILGIESKYRSGKSSEADADVARPADQLAKEWNNLRHIADEEKAVPMLIYVTADIGCPVDEIEASLAEFKLKHAQAASPTIVWLSWRRLSNPTKSTRGNENLARLMRYMWLVYFGGFQGLTFGPPATWRFTDSRGWPALNPKSLSWSFRNESN
jgi:hypothetical protein